jgi:hypothetical protein
VADRITLYITASEGLKAAIEAHRDYITAETLTVDLQFVAPPSDATVSEYELDGEKVKVGLKK